MKKSYIISGSPKKEADSTVPERKIDACGIKSSMNDGFCKKDIDECLHKTAQREIPKVRELYGLPSEGLFGIKMPSKKVVKPDLKRTEQCHVPLSKSVANMPVNDENAPVTRKHAKECAEASRMLEDDEPFDKQKELERAVIDVLIIMKWHNITFKEFREYISELPEDFTPDNLGEGKSDE